VPLCKWPPWNSFHHLLRALRGVFDWPRAEPAKGFSGGILYYPTVSGGTFLFRQSRKYATIISGIQFDSESYFYGLNGHFAQFDFR
jgi:hypothetical protein